VATTATLPQQEQQQSRSVKKAFGAGEAGLSRIGI